jgi:hypothetical protein
MEVSGKPHALAAGKEHRYLLNKRLDWSQSQSGCFAEEKTPFACLVFKP